jgi:phospholipase/carboxylesterase
MDSSQTLIVQRPEKAAQLILVFHGVGSNPMDMVPVAQAFAEAFPKAFVASVPGAFDSELAPAGRQWFSITGITDESRPARIAEALPLFEAVVRQLQEHSGVDAAGTALVGFSQGAMMALAASKQPEPVASRFIAIAGRYAPLPEQPIHENCSIHLIHGKNDAVVHYSNTVEAALRLKELGADFTADVLPFVGHALPQEMLDLAIEKLQEHIPARLWLKPGEGEEGSPT